MSSATLLLVRKHRDKDGDGLNAQNEHFIRETGARTLPAWQVATWCVGLRERSLILFYTSISNLLLSHWICTCELSNVYTQLRIQSHNIPLEALLSRTHITNNSKDMFNELITTGVTDYTGRPNTRWKLAWQDNTPTSLSCINERECLSQSLRAGCEFLFSSLVTVHLASPT